VVRLALCVPALAAASCGPTLSLQSAPTLPPVMPRAPQAPEAQVSEQEQTPRDEHRVVLSHPVGDLRAQTVAIALEGDSSLCSAFEALLPSTLVAARFTRVLLPDTVQHLAGSVERGAAGERTTLQGDLLRLLPMRATTPADQLLRVHLSAGTAQGQHARRFAIPADALARYGVAFNEFRQRVQTVQTALQSSAVASYLADCQRERANYESRGGRYEDESSRAARDEADAFASQYQRALENVRSAAATPTPQQVQERGTREETQATAQPTVSLEAVLTDLRGGETWWVTQIVGTGVDRPAALAAALRLLLGEMSGPTP
jgi:hypothetical protein